MNDVTRPSSTDPAPSDPLPPLLPVDRESMRVSLLEEQRASETQIAELARNFDEIVEAVELTNNDDEHDPEGTTIAFEKAQVTALLNQARADLEATRAALQRMDEGTYGACQECEQAIGFERLSAIPSATKCISCA